VNNYTTVLCILGLLIKIRLYEGKSKSKVNSSTAKVTVAALKKKKRDINNMTLP
jgi:hypothetical protein